jgi:MFS family permease
LNWGKWGLANFAVHCSHQPDDSGAKASLAAWWMLCILFIAYVLSFLDRYAITMLVDPIKADLRLTDVQMSLVLGPAFALFYGLFAVPLGWAADRFDRRWVVSGGLTFWSVAAAGSGLATSFTSLFLLRASVGIGEAALLPAAYSLMGDKFPRRRLAIAMSIFQSGNKVGSAIAFGLTGAAIAYFSSLGPVALPLLGVLHPWQLTLIITGLPGVLIAPLMFTFSDPRRESALAQRQEGNFKDFAKREWRLLTAMAVGFSLITICGYSLTAWVPTYMSRRFEWTAGHYGPVLSAISLAGAFSMVVKGGIVDWLFSRGMMDAHLRFYTWILAACIPLALIAFHLSSALAFLIVYGAIQVVAIQYLVYLTATLQIVAPPQGRSRAVGTFLALFTMLGMGAGPTITAMLTDYVFRDPQKLGYSLAWVAGVCVPLAYVALRVAVAQVKPAMMRLSGSAAV